MPTQPPTGLRNTGLAVERHGEHGRAWLEGMWQGDPLADAVVADFAALGQARGMGMLRAALADGIESVPAAPASLEALFAALDREPGWVDHDRLDRAACHLVRQFGEVGMVLGAASLTAGANNAVAGKPLTMTGRYVENAAVRSIEVGSWFTEVTTPGGMRRRGAGFERTVRVRMIHAFVRRHLARHPDWETPEWGLPIPQPYMAFTLAEFGHIALAAMRRLGVRYTPAELDDIYHLWRYVGHVIGVDERFAPAGERDHIRVEDLYALTSPGPDEGDRRFVAALVDDYLSRELARLVPERATWLRARAPRLIHGLQRAFVGDEAATALGIPDTRLKHVPAVLGPIAATGYRAFDLLPGGKERRTRHAFANRAREMERLRTEYRVTHELVDDAPGAQAHPAAAA